MDADVLIVGGGLAGLAVANYLARFDYEPTIVEQRAEWDRSGYGIGLWADGQAVLADLDLLSSVREVATDPRAVAVHASDEKVLTRMSIPRGQSLLLAVHRADLHATLHNHIPEAWLRMDTEPVRINETRGGVEVTFDDGSTETFDVVVGADGVHSTVREQCFTDWTVRERDTYIWSLWAHQDIKIGPDMVSVWGPGSEGFVARVGDRVGFNLAARHDTPVAGPARETLRDHAEAIGWKLPALLDGTDDEPFFDRVREVSCESWHTDRIVLIGDAAHAVHPISGMGASLALQDARVLAQELLTTDRSSSRKAFSRFEQRRRPDAKRVHRTARVESTFTLLKSPVLRRARNGLTKRTPLFEWFLKRELR
ncbi:2-polyprenyl-6-methoxyphenol hydroxylase [Halostagnicola kamekurae]|uniref:2-polyprenyl-6-methoxyphenol hydroxylase n=2 Tax=Halostagnicola kamekurae TaxID=619731 RepID=A0A1I6PZI2_9EURY|nr:2-polyprenyl-6-methoxyphenol hydroxylase [Halostagnicola kamekurae]